MKILWLSFIQWAQLFILADVGDEIWKRGKVHKDPAKQVLIILFLAPELLCAAMLFLSEDCTPFDLIKWCLVRRTKIL